MPVTLIDMHDVMHNSKQSCITEWVAFDLHYSIGLIHYWKTVSLVDNILRCTIQSMQESISCVAFDLRYSIDWALYYSCYIDRHYNVMHNSKQSSINVWVALDLRYSFGWIHYWKTVSLVDNILNCTIQTMQKSISCVAFDLRCSID